jgi:hypothetical protein
MKEDRVTKMSEEAVSEFRFLIRNMEQWNAGMLLHEERRE